MVHCSLRLGAIALLLSTATCPTQAATITLPGGTATAGAVDPGWYGFTTEASASLDAQNAPSVVISGSITNISHPKDLWMEIGLMPRSSREAANGQDGGLGVYATNWYGWANEYGMSLLVDGFSGPYVYPLSPPTAQAPWVFTITMTPTGADGGTATFAVAGQELHADSLASIAYTGDYSDAVLFLQFGSTVSGANITYTNVSATSTPEPASLLVFGSVGLALCMYRRRAG